MTRQSSKYNDAMCNARELSDGQIDRGIGPDLERGNAELAATRDELAKTKFFAESIIRCMADMLLVIDVEMKIGAVNPALLARLGYEADELMGVSLAGIFGEELAHGTIVETLMRQGAVTNVETTFRTRAGQRFPVSLSGSLMQDDHGRFQGLVCVAQDITERKALEAERRRFQDRMVEVSRSLGMAEVASSVLHNVGNVLTSISVSVGLLTQMVQGSLVGDVERLAGLLREHLDDLGTFLTADPRGQKVPTYVTMLARHLLEEQHKVMDELHVLAQHIEHVQRCVSMQQDVAKTGGIQETMPAQDLVEQALVIAKPAIETACLSVIRDYASLPPVKTDRHQAVQILVNLIRNAAQAMQGCDTRRLTLCIRAAPRDPTKARIDVCDTGIGIDPAHRVRIFAQGFTTKSDGHGFGLHSGALMAKNLGGALTVSSEGRGRGATFSLELPLAVSIAYAPSLTSNP